jgi:hypothetical protein
VKSAQPLQEHSRNKTFIGGALALLLFSLAACSDPDDLSTSSTERGIDADIRATRDAGPTLRNLGIYDGPQMYSAH